MLQAIRDVTEVGVADGTVVALGGPPGVEPSAAPPQTGSATWPARTTTA